MKMIHIKPEVEHRENLSKTPHLVLFGNSPLWTFGCFFFLCDWMQKNQYGRSCSISSSKKIINTLWRGKQWFCGVPSDHPSGTGFSDKSCSSVSVLWAKSLPLWYIANTFSGALKPRIYCLFTLMFDWLSRHGEFCLSSLSLPSKWNS